MNHESISARPSFASIAAHVFFLHDILGYQALTAGIWYLAIDMQLFGILLVLTWVIRSHTNRFFEIGRSAVVMGLGLLSAFWWNRLPALEPYAPYFFASYSLGVVIAWVELKTVPRIVFWGYAALVLLAMIVDYRLRLLMALGVVSILMLALTQGWLYRWPGSKLIATLGRLSYSLFLVHFPVSLVVNGVWSTVMPDHPWLAFLGMLVSYVLSLCAAYVFHHTVEMPLVMLGTRHKSKESLDRYPQQPSLYRS